MQAPLTSAIDGLGQRVRLLPGVARVLLSASLTLSLLAVGATTVVGQAQPTPPTKGTTRGGPAAAAITTQTIVSSGPLTSIFIGADLSAQVAHSGDTAFEAFPSTVSPGDYGTLLFVNGTLFSPDFRS